MDGQTDTWNTPAFDYKINMCHPPSIRQYTEISDQISSHLYYKDVEIPTAPPSRLCDLHLRLLPEQPLVQ